MHVKRPPDRANRDRSRKGEEYAGGTADRSAGHNDDSFRMF